MSFLNDLGKKIGGVAEVAADKAKDLAEITKLNYEISATQKQIDTEYMEIGKLIFSQEKDNPDSQVAELCRNIIAAQQTISDLDAKIQQIKTDVQTSAAPSSAPLKKFCTNCGTEVVGGSKFCPGCGATIN